MSGLYRLMVSIALKDNTKSGFAQIEKQAAANQKQVENLRKSLKDLEKTTGTTSSRSTVNEKRVQLARQEVDLRKQLVNETSSEERTRIEGEIKALGLMQKELGVRKQELSIQDKLMKDAISEQARFQREQDRAQKASASQQQLLERELVAQKYRDQQEQERRDLASIKLVAQARKDAEREAERFREERANQRANAIEEHLNSVLSNRANAYNERQSRINGFRSAMSSNFGLAGGLAAGAASGAILGGLREGAQSAGDMQMALTTTQIATGANQATMNALRDKAFEIANLTAQSADDAMKNISTLAGSGINDPKQLLGIAKPIAEFADVQFYKNHASFESSAQQGVQIAHLFGAYTQDKINPLLEQLTKVSFAMPDNLNKFLTQGGQYIPLFRAAGVRDNDTLEAGAIMDRIGMGKGRGGSSLGNILLNQMNALAMSGHVQKGRIRGLKMLGLANQDGSSNFYRWNAQDHRNEFDIIAALKQIDKSVRHVPEGLTGKAATAWQLKRLGAVNAALGLTGERAALAITPEAIAGIEDSFKRVGQSGGMENIQNKYMNNLPAQEARFQSNLNSLLTDLMWPWLNELRGGFQWMGDEAHNIQIWAHTHRDAAKQVAAGLAGVGIALGIVAGTQLMTLGAGIRGIAAGLQVLGASSMTAAGEIATAEATMGGGVAFGLGGEVLNAAQGGAAFAASRGMGIVGGLAAGGMAALAIPALQGYVSTTSAPVHGENSIASVAQGLAARGIRGASIEPDSHGGIIVVQGDIHVHAPQGSTQQQIDAVVRGIHQGAAAGKRHPASRMNQGYR